MRKAIASGASADLCGPCSSATSVCSIDQSGPVSTGHPFSAQSKSISAASCCNACLDGCISPNLPTFDFTGISLGIAVSFCRVFDITSKISVAYESENCSFELLVVIGNLGVGFVVKVGDEVSFFGSSASEDAELHSSLLVVSAARTFNVLGCRGGGEGSFGRGKGAVGSQRVARSGAVVVLKIVLFFQSKKGENC